MYKVTIDEVIISIFIWLIAFLNYKSAYRKPHNKKDNYVFFLIIVCVFSTFAYTTGDFAHYHELYESIYLGAPSYDLEEIYCVLLNILPHNYYLWRFVIWGASLIFLILTYKRIQSPVRSSCLFFVLILISGFSNLRNTLGLEIMFFSLTFFINPIGNKKISYMLGFLGLLVCIPFHKSMPLYVGISLLSFFVMTRWMYIISLLSFPFIYVAFKYIASYLLSLDLGGGDFENSGSHYLEGENFSVTNLNGYFSLILCRLPILLLLYYVISRTLQGVIDNKVVVYFSKYAYWLIYISCVFFNQPTSSFLSVRFWDASLYSLVFVFPLALYMKKDKIISLGYSLLILSNIYSLLYSIYKV